MLYLKEKGIHTVFHYIPLHSSPAGKLYSKCVGDMSNTQRISETLLRLPIYTELGDDEVGMVVEAISNWARLRK